MKSFLRFPYALRTAPVFALTLLLAPSLFLGCQKDAHQGEGGEAGSSSGGSGPTATVPAVAGTPGEFPQIFADVAENALPAVVSIYTETDVTAQDGDPLEQFFGDDAPESAPRRESGLGSGVILDEDGTILTNNHVIEGASRIRIQFHDGSEFDAEVVGADAPTDLAVVRVKPAKDGKKDKDGKSGPAKFRALPLGDSERLRVGEWVIAVGSPYGLSETVTTGIISAKGRHNTGINSYENFLQTDAAINPGNSGGALLNLRGELVGINTAIFSRNGGYQGIGFAIPIGMARKISAALIRDGAVTRGWLGVSIQPLDADLAEALGISDRSGALVGGVLSRSPAEKAGIRRGDVITRIDKLPIPDPNTLLNHVALLSPGTWIEVGLNRAGKSMTLKARVAKREEPGETRAKAAGTGDSKLAALGLGLEALTPELRREYSITGGVTGALVVGIEIDSRADRAGLQEGDVIVEANRAKIMNPRDMLEAIRKAGKNGKILLVVNREGETFFTAM